MKSQKCQAEIFLILIPLEITVVVFMGMVHIPDISSKKRDLKINKSEKSKTERREVLCVPNKKIPRVCSFATKLWCNKALGKQQNKRKESCLWLLLLFIIQSRLLKDWLLISVTKVLILLIPKCRVFLVLSLNYTFVPFGRLFWIFVYVLAA